MIILMGLKHCINFTVLLSKSLYFYSHKKYRSLPRISEKVHITTKSRKTEFDKYATSEVSDFSIASIYIIQFVMDQNCHHSS